MGLSKSAKRGIGIFSHLQWKTKNQRYHMKRMEMTIDTNKFDASIVQAGMDAISKMRENANDIQKLSDSEKDTIPADTEGRTEPSVPVQPETGENRQEGTETGETGGGK